MPRPYRHHVLLAEHLDTRAVMTRAQIERAFGVHALKACLTEGSVSRVLPGVYASPSHALDPEVRCRAAAAWIGGNGALTGAAALWAYGCFRRPPTTVALAVAPEFKRASPPWIRLYRTRGATPMRRVQGMTAVTPALAIVHEWTSRRSRREAGWVVEAARTGRVRRGELARAVVAAPRVWARKELLQLAQLTDDGVSSFLEHRARAVVFRGGPYSHLQWQHRVVVRGREKFLDAYDETARLALEFHGERYHSGDEAVQRDAEREALIATLGIQVLRFTYRDIMERPGWCRDIYREVRRARLALLGVGESG